MFSRPWRKGESPFPPPVPTEYCLRFSVRNPEVVDSSSARVRSTLRGFSFN